MQNSAFSTHRERPAADGSTAQIKVSIVIPARDAAETIATTLQSLLDQTAHSWEAIVVVDGSTDQTVAVVQSFAARDTRFRIFRQEPLGVSVARNRGVEMVRSDWLLFLDADRQA